MFIINKIRNFIDPEENSIKQFVIKNAEKIKARSIVLDAGAGLKPYRKFFNHTLYESTDFEDAFEKKHYVDHNFVCNLEKIPRPNEYYDLILNTQVLEHVKYPEKVLNEFNRVLKPGGQVLLTVPQGWGVHGAPYHFFNFTNYGIELLADDTNFNVQYLSARGGMFCYLAKRMMIVPSYVYNQYRDIIKKRKLELISVPIYFVMKILLEIIVPFMLIKLDRFDKKQDFTLGYECILVKKDSA